MSARRSISMVFMWLCAAAGGLLLWSAPALAQRMHEFSKSFGSEGSGEGQLLQPGALAVNDSTGDVYVVDRGNARVEIFSSAGAFVGQFNGSASPTGVFSWPGTGPNKEGSEAAVAVDNSSNPLDPSKGDVYVTDPGHSVIDKFSSSGAYIGQLTGTSPESHFLEVSGVAVDRNGMLWIQASFATTIYQFNDAAPVNEYESSFKPNIPNEGGHTNTFGYVGITLDAEGNFYVGSRPSIYERFTFPIEFSKTGEPLVEKLDDEETTGVAVDESSGDLYVDHGTSVAAYGPSSLSIERFGSAQLQVSEGIAVDPVTGTVYISDASRQAIDVFKSFVVPDVSTGSASNFTETSVTLSGVVDPDGLPVTSCVFEYGTTTAYGQTAECSPSSPSGSGPVAVSANVAGLERVTGYHYRLSVSNANGSNQGQDHTFVTPEPVALSEEAVSDVSSTSALFSVQVDPGGADTTYRFEYGTSVSYGESVPVSAGDLGTGTSEVTAAARAESLLEEVTYHVRVAASNVLGTVYGPDLVFTTQAGGGAFALPDSREWEMVSPPSKDGAIIKEIGGFAAGGAGSPGLIEASVDGSAVSYYASAPVGTGVSGNAAPFGPSQVLSRRGAGGWSSEDIALPHKAIGEGLSAQYWFFSPDLSRSIVDSYGPALFSPEATEQTPYLHDGNGSYLPLVTASNVPPGIKFGPPTARVEDPLVRVATPDLSHVIISSPFTLTNNAIETTSPEEDNLYEWSGGRLQLVNELPDHTASDGAFLGGEESQDTRYALSNDGSRVFFRVGFGGDEALYMRDTATGQTVEVDAPAPGVSPPPDHRADFQIASADGSKVFFLDAQPLTLDSTLKPVEHNVGSTLYDLYVYDTVTGSLTDLSVDRNAGEWAGVQSMVVGAGEDGSIVYFVAKGKLSEGAEPGQDNMYMESETGSTWSSPRLVAVLSEDDSPDWGEAAGGSDLRFLEHLTSRVSASGRYVTFMSDRSLTGYDNRDAVSGQPDEEVYLYDEATSELRCVSCNPTGARPDGMLDLAGREGQIFVDGALTWKGRWLAGSTPEWTVPNQGIGYVTGAYQSRVLSDEGRMFFDSADGLVAQDTNGTEDVYEYEPQGVGGCVRAGGCVSLISPGTSSAESVFLDASGRGPGGEEGEDVFFLTAARLSSRDVDASFDVYDAHMCSKAVPCVSVPVVPPACTSGDSCKAAPSPQPAVFGAPSSATFAGAGNVTPEPPPAAAKPKKKKTTRCTSGKRLSHGKCVKAKQRKKTLKAKQTDRKGRR